LSNNPREFKKNRRESRNRDFIMFRNIIMSEKDQREAWRNFVNTREYKKSCKEAGEEWDAYKEREREEFIFEIAPGIAAKAKAQRLRRMTEEYHAAHNPEGHLITLCIDQKQSEAEAVASQNAIVDDLRKANYQWLVCAKAVYEYWGHTDAANAENLSTNLKWNPHLHILVKATGKMSVIRQHLARKFKDKKHGIYIFDVRQLPYEEGEEYLNGYKIAEKMDGVVADKSTREKYNLADLIII